MAISASTWQYGHALKPRWYAPAGTIDKLVEVVAQQALPLARREAMARVIVEQAPLEGLLEECREILQGQSPGLELKTGRGADERGGAFRHQLDYRM